MAITNIDVNRFLCQTEPDLMDMMSELTLMQILQLRETIRIEIEQATKDTDSFHTLLCSLQQRGNLMDVLKATHTLLKENELERIKESNASKEEMNKLEIKIVCKECAQDTWITTSRYFAARQKADTNNVKPSFFCKDCIQSARRPALGNPSIPGSERNYDGGKFHSGEW